MQKAGRSVRRYSCPIPAGRKRYVEARRLARIQKPDCTPRPQTRIRLQSAGRRPENADIARGSRMLAHNLQSSVLRNSCSSRAGFLGARLVRNVRGLWGRDREAKRFHRLFNREQCRGPHHQPCSRHDTQALGGLRPKAAIVVAGREIRGGAFDRVCIEYEKGLTSAVSHLVSLGHRAIGWMGGGSNTATARRGIRIYREVLLKHGLRPTNLWQYTCLPSRHEGYAGMRQLLKVAPELTAVVCFSDLLAIGAMRALHQQGMIPGRDMSVIGFDDLEEACCAIPTR